MSEHDDQVAIFDWARMSEGKYPDLWLLKADMNAGKRTKRLGANLKRAGMKAGVPDMQLCVARGGYIGLWIEQKVKGGRVRPSQDEWHKRLEDVGHRVIVSWSIEESIQTLIDYLEGRITRYHPPLIPAVTKRTFGIDPADRLIDEPIPRHVKRRHKQEPPR